MTTRIKTLVILSVFTVLSTSAQVFNISVVNGQIISKYSMTETIDGICNQNEVYGLFDGSDGQVEAKCSLTTKQIETLLNEKVDFLVKNPNYKDKGQIGCFINCKGTVVEWDISVKSKDADLDRQILEIFKSLSNWTAGTLNGKNVDSRLLFKYKIKKGHLTLD
jgi:hypothetical protein